MKTKKFSIDVLEQGRLSDKESHEITGGIVGGSSLSYGSSLSFAVTAVLTTSYSGCYICDGLYEVRTCYTFTICQAKDIIQSGYNACPGVDGYTQCPHDYRRKE